jgi:CPA1 family monovalent cation:H+ antiporter
MEHPIETTVGIYLGLLLLAVVVGIATKLIAHLPYTIFLTLVGVGIGYLHLGPPIEETGFSHDLIFYVFLPPLLFQGAFHMELDRLLRHLTPIVLFAVPGVIVSTCLVGGLVWWQGGIESLLIALLFGALISPTDPVSVLALFREANVPHDLRTLVEGESLFNDATGVVIFAILLHAAMHVTTGGEGGGINLAEGALEFGKVALGGLVLGAVLGLMALFLLRRLNDHLLENAICIVLAFGSFWLGEFLHVSGVIATVMAGLLVGNHGRRLAMSERTRNTVENFFESIDFLVNSLLFILIGLELRELPAEVPVNPWRLIVIAIIAMLAGRAAVAYTFYWGLNRAGTKRPPAWKHVLFWGGLRGSIPIALLLHIPTADNLPADSLLAYYRPALIEAGFGCVFFSLVIQGITMKPLLRALNIGGDTAGNVAGSEAGSHH